MKHLAVAGAALLCCEATAASSPVADLAGRYAAPGSRSGPIEDFDGQSSILEVVGIDARHAYFSATLQGFVNGSLCNLSGVAHAEGDALVYKSPQAVPDTGRICALRIRRKGHEILFEDREDSCKDFCGAHGSFDGATLPWRSKRPIAYLPKLKVSQQYRDALTEWRTGKPVNP